MLFWNLQKGIKGKQKNIRTEHQPGMVVRAFNSSTWEAEAGRFLSSKPAWSTK
jgi:major histocompatibility complex class I